jgi:hypothetical protein
VQDPGAIEDFRRAAIAAPAGVAACAMLDPDYEACRTRLVADQDWYRGLHAALFGEEAAAFLYGRATISSGVFCARADAPLWPAWEAQVRRLYQAGPRGELGHMAEQCAFNLVLHQGGGVALLPSMNNWHCHGAPMERRGSRVVVAGSGRAPRIVHLSDFRGMGATYRARRLLFDPDAAPPAGAPGPAAAAVLDELAALRRAHALHRAEAIALRAQLAARQAELEAAGAAASRAASESLDRHRAEMAALRASLSWRVTAPLRALRRGMAAAARRARALPE